MLNAKERINAWLNEIADKHKALRWQSPDDSPVPIKVQGYYNQATTLQELERWEQYLTEQASQVPPFDESGQANELWQEVIILYNITANTERQW